jgi:hypothetical protein
VENRHLSVGVGDSPRIFILLVFVEPLEGFVFVGDLVGLPPGGDILLDPVGEVKI